jgi:transglutaminase-like putative cysteine protease
MPILQIRHLTRYRYAQPVGFGEHRMMFRPRESYDQRVLESRLTIGPEPAGLRYVQDLFGNCVGVARFDRRDRELTFESLVRLEHTPAPLALDVDDELTAGAPFRYDPHEVADLALSIGPQHPDPGGAVMTWAQRFAPTAGRTKALAALVRMTHAIREEFTYAKRLHGPAQEPAETLAARSGSCRDFALLMIEAARRLGLAARFVSGYIYSASISDGRTGGGHTHAWVRIYLPSCGWVEFDPTNGIVGNTDLIRVAVARDPIQAIPLYGSWIGEAGSYLGMDVEVDLQVEGEHSRSPRVRAAAAG